jgi:hypothetical protein
MDDFQIENITAIGAFDSWDRIKSIWAASDRVYCSPPRGHYPLALRIVDYLVKNRADSDKFFYDQLDDTNPIIVGYCILTLCKMESPLFPSLRERFNDRSEIIKQSCGCFTSNVTLSDFVREIDPESMD